MYSVKWNSYNQSSNLKIRYKFNESTKLGTTFFSWNIHPKYVIVTPRKKKTIFSYNTMFHLNSCLGLKMIQFLLGCVHLKFQFNFFYFIFGEKAQLRRFYLRLFSKPMVHFIICFGFFNTCVSLRKLGFLVL